MFFIMMLMMLMMLMMRNRAYECFRSVRARSIFVTSTPQVLIGGLVNEKSTRCRPSPNPACVYLLFASNKAKEGSKNIDCSRN